MDMFSAIHFMNGLFCIYGFSGTNFKLPCTTKGKAEQICFDKLITETSMVDLTSLSSI